MLRPGKFAFSLFLILGLTLSSSLLAETIYQSVDAAGNPVYSDTPTPNALKKQLEPLPSYSDQRIEKNKKASHTAVNDSGQATESPAAPVFDCKSFQVTQPEKEGTIWSNVGDINISLALKPSTLSDQKIVFLLDGKAVLTSNQLTAQLTGIDRGAHTLSAELRSADDKLLCSTPSVRFYLHQAIQTSPPPIPHIPHRNSQ